MPVDKSGARIRQMFGEIARRYDLMNHTLSGGTDIYWRWRTVRIVPPVGDAPILDVCTGTGDLAFAYAKAAAGKVPVVGTDFTHEMLVLANEKADKLSKGAAPPAVFLEADTQQLPFPDNTFQIVSVAFGLRNVSDTRAGLREMARVCHPGGKVVVLEFSQPRNRVFGAIYAKYFKHVLPRIGQIFAKNRQSAYEYLPASVSEFPSGEKLTALMDECGMVRSKFIPFTMGVCTLYVGEKA
jgi:demethylmenaquinone methyltransferase/2-methoxy-6-polyprenyl-1,4-benzoquinol methylase